MRLSLKESVCLYCGESAGTVEHWPPQSYCQDGLLLAACGECNVLAGTNFPTDLFGRITHVKWRLRLKYANALKPRVQWSEDELREMGWQMQWRIRKSRSEHERAKRRVEWDSEKHLLKELLPRYSKEEYAKVGVLLAPGPKAQRQKEPGPVRSPALDGDTMR